MKCMIVTNEIDPPVHQENWQTQRANWWNQKITKMWWIFHFEVLRVNTGKLKSNTFLFQWCSEKKNWGNPIWWNTDMIWMRNSMVFENYRTNNNLQKKYKRKKKWGYKQPFNSIPNNLNKSLLLAMKIVWKTIFLCTFKWYTNFVRMGKHIKLFLRNCLII